MEIKNHNLHKMLAWLSQVLTCPVCGAHYSAGNTRLIDGGSDGTVAENKAVVHSECANCRSSVMFNLAMLGQEIFSVGVISDLSASDALKFRKSKALSADDVLEFHRLLKGL